MILSLLIGLLMYSQPVPQPTPIPPPEPPKTPAETILELTGDDYLMLNIACAESNLNPLAKNPNSSAKGTFQILDGTWNYFECEGDVFDVHDNTVCAMKIAEDGLHHWNASVHIWKYTDYAQNVCLTS